MDNHANPVDPHGDRPGMAHPDDMALPASDGTGPR